MVAGGGCVVAQGACMVAGGACVAKRGDVHGKRGAWVAKGGVRGIRRDTEIRSMSGQYASYWNAFLF